MGARRRKRDSEFDKLSNTEQLFKWIRRVRSKKIKYLRSRRRNIRVEAVLGHALYQAENELRSKQIARIKRWQQLKKQMDLKNNKNSSSGHGDMDHQNCGGPEVDNAWAGNLCPELNSLDTFMSKLSGIKAPLKR